MNNSSTSCLLHFFFFPRRCHRRPSRTSPHVKIIIVFLFVHFPEIGFFFLRYVDYFAGLLSGNIRINSAPLYLTHVTVLGAPAFEGNTEGVVCRAFIKIYEGLMPVYTSGVHRITPSTRQFTVNVAGDRRNQGLQLRGDVLVKCYHKHPKHREVIFACQFHTCTISDYTLSFTRHELDSAAYDLRFPLDGAVEFHFSSTPMPRLPLPAPTPAVMIDPIDDDPIVRWDSYADLSLGVIEQESDVDHHHGECADVATKKY